MNAVAIRRIVLAAVFLFVLWAIWSRTFIFVWLRGTDLLILLAGLAVVFLLVDHFLNRERR